MFYNEARLPIHSKNCGMEVPTPFRVARCVRTIGVHPMIRTEGASGTMPYKPCRFNRKTTVPRRRLSPKAPPKKSLPRTLPKQAFSVETEKQKKGKSKKERKRKQSDRPFHQETP